MNQLPNAIEILAKTKGKPRYWLMKSEPEVFSIDHLKKDGITAWEGVRNYQARNFMMNEMKLGELVLFYHSNAEAPFETGIAGLAEVCELARPDLLQFDKQSNYFDPKATKEKPIWFCVKIKFKAAFKKTFTLNDLKATPDLSEMLVIRQGQRLSIQPVFEKDFRYIIKKCTT